MLEKPKILTLNLKSKSNKALTDNKYNVYQGSLGKLVDTKNKKYEFKYFLLNYDFPANAHEYDIVIVDLSDEETIDYVESDNLRTKNKTENNTYLICKFPQTIFDPRGLSANAFVNEMREILKKECLLIIFQGENEDIEYKIVKENGEHPISEGVQEANPYEFIPNMYFEQNKFGHETTIIIKNNEFATFLEKYNKRFSYKNIFSHPTIWSNNDTIPDPRFHPLIKNISNEIVSYVYFSDFAGIYIFPILDDNSDFILEFIQNIGPTLHPSIFPFSTQNKWIENTEYALPNQERLLEEKEAIFKDFQKNTQEKELEISKNTEKYNFLHKILTETGDDLVSSVIKLLEWLGFQSVIDMDGEAETIKEEDIQIETDKGLLVIEVKGIGGTSKDSECSQISKIKYRRAKERGNFDVFGLYIVNHQRHLPTKQRKNPPFTKEQKQDALNEERGLLTTWQLFKLYFDIQNNIITKEEARESFYDYGLISFKPKNLKLIGIIEETFSNGEVFILNLENIEVKTGDTLFIERNNEFQKLVVSEIKLNDKIVTKISSGEVGIKGNKKVRKKSKVWIKNLP